MEMFWSLGALKKTKIRHFPSFANSKIINSLHILINIGKYLIKIKNHRSLKKGAYDKYNPFSTYLIIRL